MESFLLSLDRKRKIRMLEDALKEDKWSIFKEFSKVLAYKELCRDETNYESLIESYKEKIQFIQCFVCPNFQSRVMGKVFCKGEPLD